MDDLSFGWKITWSVTIIATLYIYNPPILLQGTTTNVELTFSVGLQLVPSKTIRIDDTKYDI